MPDLNFQVTGVEACARSIVPLLKFKLRVTNTADAEQIHSVLLAAQLQLQPAQRAYNANEKEKLSELFGRPERWGQTLRNRLWAHTNTTISAFTGQTEAMLPVPCTCDLNVGAAKYFRALEDGEVSVLFLFSGSVFYAGPDGRLQVTPISWNKECVYRMAANAWRELMERHFPNTEWISLRRDVFEQLHRYKREHGLVTWEDTVGQLLTNPGETRMPERREEAVA
jgi:hypothetical protein